MQQKSLKKIVEEKLKSNIQKIEKLEIEDKSSLHEGHAEISSSNNEYIETHLHIVISSSDFKNMAILDVHKKIYDILKHEISLLHAISIDAS